MPHAEVVTPLISVSWNLLFQLVNTLILFLILKRFLFVPVRNLMLKRQTSIDDAFSDADTKQKNANEILAEYQKKMDDLNNESRDIVKAAKVKADKQADAIIEEARAKVENMLRQADEEIARNQQKAINDLRDEISEIAILAAEKIMQRELNDKSQNDMIEKLIEEAGNSKWQS